MAIQGVKDDRMARLEHLLTTPMTYQEAAQVLGIPAASVRSYLRDLHKEGRVHISDWRQEKHRNVRLFKAGPGKDAERPVRGPSEEEIFARPKFHVIVRRDDLVAALFGEAA